MNTSNKVPNRLVHESSPYLIQHAYNPVNWYPWGSEAFEKAKNENKPVFLSIGYSTCHWCHVMEHESFEDGEVADILNKHFVSIKVDREERPDVDAVYMSVCQSLNGQGGWPLTILMTPDQQPFFAATYLPKTTRYGSMGLIGLLSRIVDMWENEPDTLKKSAAQISDHIRREGDNEAEAGDSAQNLVSSAYDELHRRYDRVYGGFGSAPKFPTPHNLLFLMKYYLHEKDDDALLMVEKTLMQMYRGGIFDHIGGGFSRYSTDQKWLVPHFEKMLYDNALLIYACSEAYRLTKNPLYKRIVEKTTRYTSRELTNYEGAFFCAQDADSEGVEGKYYTFTPDEIISVLGTDDGKLFCDYFDITEKGNFEGKSIPNLLKNENYDKLTSRIDELCDKVYDYRLNRTRLHKDDKILVSWNALMICALSNASRVFGDDEYLRSAQSAQIFIDTHLTDKSGRLMVSRRGDSSHGEGKIDDYAFFAWAMLELYDATFDIFYLGRAINIADNMLRFFFDEVRGGFYIYAGDAEQLIARPKELYDGAVPSGNSAALYVLSRLSALTGESKWQNAYEKQLDYISSGISDYPASYCFSLLTVIDAINPRDDLICTTQEQNAGTAVRRYIDTSGRNDTNVIIKDTRNATQLAQLAPFTADYPIPESGSQYYLCKNGTCLPPTADPEELYASRA